LLVHPAIAESCASAIDGVACDPVAGGGLASAAVEGPDLLRRFAGVSDGRSDQGRDHPVAVVLTLCAAAVLAGMRSFTAIAGWVADVPADLLARLYYTPTPGFPSKTTLWRVLTGVDASAVDAAIAAWLVEQAQRAMPGRIRPASDTSVSGIDQADQADGPIKPMGPTKPMGGPTGPVGSVGHCSRSRSTARPSAARSAPTVIRCI
jgi:hypothetical protein